MRQKLAQFILPAVVLLLALLGQSLLIPVTATAARTCDTGKNTSQDQVLGGLSQTGSDCDDSGVANAIKAIIQVLSIVVGVIAVIAVINGGFKYITSGGDSAKIANAKNTLIYALIGLAIAALAQFLVHFVLTTANGAATGDCPKDQHHATADGSCIPN